MIAAALMSNFIFLHILDITANKVDPHLLQAQKLAQLVTVQLSPGNFHLV